MCDLMRCPSRSEAGPECFQPPGPVPGFHVRPAPQDWLGLQVDLPVGLLDGSVEFSNLSCKVLRLLLDPSNINRRCPLDLSHAVPIRFFLRCCERRLEQ